MAGITCHVLMKATQWKFGFTIVVKLDSLTERRPACGRVTVLAGDGNGSVRVPRPHSPVLLCRQGTRESQKKTCKKYTRLAQPSLVSPECRCCPLICQKSPALSNSRLHGERMQPVSQCSPVRADVFNFGPLCTRRATRFDRWQYWRPAVQFGQIAHRITGAV